MLATLRELRHHGVKVIDLAEKFLFESDFSAAGLIALAQIAGVNTEYSVPGAKLTPHDAVFAHGEVTRGSAPPCMRLSNGTGVWIRLGNPLAPGGRDFCPSRHPSFYGPATAAPRAPHKST
jgi:hypothetical protein